MKTAKAPFNVDLEQYRATRWKNIHKYLEKYLKKKDSESLHCTRVEIKKLTALFQLVEYCEENFDSRKELKPVAEIFKLLGKLRDNKNAGKFSKKFKIDSPGLKEAHGPQNHTRKNLKKTLKKYCSQLNKLENEGVVDLKNIRVPQINLYLHKIKREIISMAGHGALKNRLHEIRKRIKNIIYLVSYSNDNILSKKEIVLLDKLQDKIGAWHDIDKFYGIITAAPQNKKLKAPLLMVEKERVKLLNESKALLLAFIKVADVAKS